MCNTKSLNNKYLFKKLIIEYKYIFTILNPFAEVENDIHIRILQIGRRRITIIEGMPITNMKTCVSKMKKLFCCSGNIDNNIIKLSGDQSVGVYKFLTDNKIGSNIIAHGNY